MMFDALKKARQAASQNNLLKSLVRDCDRLLGSAGESISLGLAQQALTSFAALDEEHRQEFYDLLAARYNPDPPAVVEAAKRYEATGLATDLVKLAAAADAPRRELIRRLNRAPGGTASIVQMRREILANKARRKDRAAVDRDLEHLLSSWFNPGFLQLRKIDWNSPASLLEKIIGHEAVHAIEGFADLRRRMERDRRLFAYFHPALPGEPLIFVEVALLPEIPRAIAPLLEREAGPDPRSRNYKVATFYSISNCQPGLKGVNLGNFLIKRVAEALQGELPQIRQFCTLSPVPSFRSFLQAKEPLPMGILPEEKIRAMEKLRSSALERLAAAGHGPLPAPLLKDLSRLCAVHLLHSAARTYPHADPVARFHLGNGARLKQINPHADLSAKGLRESCGFMVNYAYELAKVEEHYERFAAGEVVISQRVRALLP